MVIVELQCFRWKCVLNALRGKSKRNSDKVQKTRKVLLLVNNWKREKARSVVLENSCCGDFQLHSSQITFVATHQCFLFYSAFLFLYCSPDTSTPLLTVLPNSRIICSDALPALATDAQFYLLLCVNVL